MDIISEFIGMDWEKTQAVAEEVKQKRIEIATAIVKLIEYPEWKVFESEIDRLINSIDQPCEAYANNPSLATFHSGEKRSLQVIKDFVSRQNEILKEYAENKTE